MLDLLSKYILHVLGGITVLGLVAIWKEFFKVTRWMERCEPYFKRIDDVEKRVDIHDQITSNLAGQGVSTRLIAENRQDIPKFAFAKSKHRTDQ